MLVLSRYRNETIRIGDDIIVTVVAINGGKIRIGIEAPPDTKVLRGELYIRKPEFGDDKETCTKI